VARGRASAPAHSLQSHAHYSGADLAAVRGHCIIPVAMSGVRRGISGLWNKELTGGTTMVVGFSRGHKLPEVETPARVTLHKAPHRPPGGTRGEASPRGLAQTVRFGQQTTLVREKGLSTADSKTRSHTRVFERRLEDLVTAQSLGSHSVEYHRPGPQEDDAQHEQMIDHRTPCNKSGKGGIPRRVPSALLIKDAPLSIWVNHKACNPHDNDRLYCSIGSWWLRLKARLSMSSVPLSFFPAASSHMANVAGAWINAGYLVLRPKFSIT
jgi:hypothetical protein